jgi:uracil-DNA glycosylase
MFLASSLAFLAPWRFRLFSLPLALCYNNDVAASVPEGESGRSVSPRLAGMRELEAQVRTCQLCKLSKTRTNAVPGEGYVRTDVMFIGEAPGYHEDRQGRPFIGAAGQFLNELLEIAGLQRERVYIANVIKCRPPNNRDPEPDELAACGPYIERQIALINPKVIVTLGRFSMARFFPGERISQIHGTARMVDGRMCVAMYHPAAGLHQASLADIIRTDFRKLPVYLEQARSVQATPPAAVAEKQVERVEQAVEAREEVIHEPATGAVMETAQAYEAPAAPPEPPVEAETPQQAPAAQPAAAPASKQRKRKEAPKYEQMSFFDL